MRSRRWAAIRRRGQGAGGVWEARSGQDARGLRCCSKLAEEPPRLRGQDRCRGLLLRRRHREHARDALAGSGGRGPFYGNQPSAEDVAKIKAPLLIHYAEHDERINAGWPAFETALKANHVRYEVFKYPGTQHGFNNDTTPRYDEAAAKLA